MADEETGSAYGLDYVVKNHADLFGPDDLFLVPDFGVKDSSLMEVSEKSMLWLKVEVFGKQCHASTPGEGVNTLMAAADFILRTRRLHDEFPATDALFSPPESTFSPTRKDANVPNVNTIPGTTCSTSTRASCPSTRWARSARPSRPSARRSRPSTGCASPTRPCSRSRPPRRRPWTAKSCAACPASIREVYGVEPVPAGVGGGTVAAFLRRSGREAVVWATCEHNAHQPNERSHISAQLGDAKVMARMLYL